MDKITIFFYLKTYQYIQTHGFRFEHTLFHLQRFLRIEKDVRWERLFVFDDHALIDDGKDKMLRTLFHHDFLHFKTYEVTPKGLRWLDENKESLSELNEYLEEFFAQYEGEFAFENSCFTRGSTHTLACHLCAEPKCLQAETWTDIISDLNLFRLKTPYKSFSQKTTSL